MITLATVKKCVNSHFFKFGLPFLGLIIGSSFLLKDVQRIKYDEKRKKTDTKALQALGIKTEVNMEEEYQKVQAANEGHEWMNVRGPRPYEDNTEFFANKEIQEKRIKEYFNRGDRALFKS